jgi:hypothetical protein
MDHSGVRVMEPSESGAIAAPSGVHESEIGGVPGIARRAPRRF